MYKYELIILHSGRIQRLQECIQHVGRIGRSDVKVIISNNSGNPIASETLLAFERIEIRNREKCSFATHFNLIISELQSEFSVFLHDDDWVDDAYFTYLDGIWEDNAVVAASTNATVRTTRTLGKKQNKYSSLSADCLVETSDSLFSAYFHSGLSLSLPFSLYCYRTSTLKLISYDDTIAGKYSDIFFLNKLLQYGPLYWIAIPFGTIGNLGDNDSASESPRERVMQIKALCRLDLSLSTKKLAKRHLVTKIMLKLASDIKHLRNPAPTAFLLYKALLA